MGVRAAAARRLAIALALIAATACDDGGPRTRLLSIATGGTGGVYYPYGGGIASVLNQHLPGVRATAEVTAASIDNLKFLRAGRVDLAFTFADALADAVAGTDAFKGSPLKVAALAALYPSYMHLVVLQSSAIRTIDDLRGAAVSTGSPGSGTELFALRLLQAAGIDPARDVRRQGLGVAESAEALKDGKVDAFFWGGGIPTAAVQDLSHTPGIAIRLIPTAHLLPTLRQRFGEVYLAMRIPRAAYPGVGDAVDVAGAWNLLVVDEAMDEQLAYDITRVIFEQQPALAAIHPEARNLSLESASTHSTAPFHTGAIRYYRERGAWRASR